MWMAKPGNQPQVPPIAFSHNTHTIGHACLITHIYPHHNGVHTHGWIVERLDDHTVMTNTPWFDGNHSLHQHHCGAQHPHPTHSLLPSSWWCTVHTHATLCTTSGLESVVLCMPCVAIPLLSLLSTHLPFSLTLCVSLALTLCQTHSPVNE